MLTLQFTIDCVPVAKGRPRFSKRGFSYTPAKTRDYESMLKLCAQEYMRMNDYKPLEAPISLRLAFFMPIPKSTPKYLKTVLDWHTKKPDLDNLAKCVDAFNGILWNDDSQIAMMSISKKYSDLPRIEITVRELE